MYCTLCSNFQSAIVYQFIKFKRGSYLIWVSVLRIGTVHIWSIIFKQWKRLVYWLALVVATSQKIDTNLLLPTALIDNDVKNTSLAVSRWYGNNIGPRRFKRINEVGLNAARNMPGSTVPETFYFSTWMVSERWTNDERYINAKLLHG